MKKLKGIAGFCTALLMTFQLSAQTIVLAAEQDSFQINPVNITDNGYGYEVEGVSKSSVSSYQAKKLSRAAASKLPSAYDPRNSGELTTVKNQATTGSCWAFSALACAEQDLIKKGLENPSVDFSVPALVLSSNSGTATGTDDFASGGNWLFAASAFANGQGLCYEDYEPFLAYGTKNMTVSEDKKNVSEYRLNYAMELSNAAEVKQKIQELGAVSASYFAGTGYMNEDNTAYYNPDTDENTVINHAVTIVGWDDNYSKGNFKYTPEHNGAWLVKGSWGADQDNDGYYWISYDQKEFGQWNCYDFEKSCDNTYFYSKMTGYMVNASNDGAVYAANVFTAKESEKLDKAGFVYVGNTGSADYTLSVYTDVSSGGPVGVLESQVSGSVSANGFYTVDIPEDVLLEKGESYSVVIKFSGDDNRGYAVAESGKTSKATAGQSYISINGRYWTDVKAGNDDSMGNFFIYAYTDDTAKPDKSGLENALAKYGTLTGCEREANNARKVLADENALKNDIKNAEKLLKSAAKENDEALVITNESQWESFAKRVTNGETFEGKLVTLESDLDFGGKTISPVGNYSNAFKGYFDGNGHVIKDAVISASDYSGLFANIKYGAKINNISLKDCTVKGYYAGGIVGFAQGEAVRACTFDGTVSGSVYSGGIVGRAACGIITECSSNISENSTKGTNAFVGGRDISMTVVNASGCYSANSDSSVSSLSAGQAMSQGAYAMNTYGEQFKDSGKWTLEDSLVRQTSYSEQPSHKITFDAVTQTIEVCSDYAGKVIFPDVNVQQGCVLSWYRNGEPVNGDTVFTENSTVSAKVTSRDKARFDYVLNGGENSGLNPLELDEGESADLAEPVKKGAQFTGWYDNPKLEGEPVTKISYADGSKVLYAGWKAYTYTVTFTDINGNAISTQTVEYGKSAVAPDAPEIKGRHFVGWDKDFSAVTSNMTVKALYTERKLVSNCIVKNLVSEKYFTGYEITQDNVKLYYDNTLLVRDVDYTLEYADNIMAGKAQMIFTGKGEYSGTSVVTFAILPRYGSLTSVYYVDTLAFTGKALKPDVMVTDRGKFLMPGHDYVVSYSSNVKVGQGTIKINFIGNYQGTVTKNFTINPAKQKIQSLQTRYKGFYVDFVQKASATGYELQYSTRSDLLGAPSLWISSNKTDKKTVSGLSAGKKYYVKVRSYTDVNGTRYYGAWSDTKSITAAKNNFAKAKVKGIKTKNFTGKNITQSIKVTYGKKTLKNGKDYTVKYSSNKSVGTAKITITGKGSYGGVITKTFKINPAKQKIQKLTAKKKGFFIDYVQKGSATGYQISYSTASNFKGAKVVKVTSNKNDKKTIKKLKSKKTYYVRVRSYTVKRGKTYYGPWSDTSKIRTK